MPAWTSIKIEGPDIIGSTFSIIVLSTSLGSQKVRITGILSHFDVPRPGSHCAYTIGIVTKHEGELITGITGIKVNMSIGICTTNGWNCNLIADSKSIGKTSLAFGHISTDTIGHILTKNGLKEKLVPCVIIAFRIRSAHEPIQSFSGPAPSNLTA